MDLRKRENLNLKETKAFHAGKIGKRDLQSVCMIAEESGNC